jgi:predicted lipoprotein with Yx(FWY)xxD motif
MRRSLAAAALAALVVAAAASAQPAGKLVVRTTDAGRVLADGRGHTLYLFTVDKGKTSSCYGACAAAWPPFLARGKTVAGAGVKAKLLGTTKRKDGKLQVTYAGHPLYFYAADTRAGETAGQGVESTWYVVAPSGKRITAMPSAGSGGTTTTPPGDGGGYGGYGP